MKHGLPLIILVCSFLLIEQPVYSDSQKSEGDEVPVNPALPEQINTPPKKQKPHFIGARRPSEKTEEKKHPTLKIKNQWVKSKTHPKKKEKDPSKKQEEENETPSEIPYFYPGGALAKKSPLGMASLLFPENEEEITDETSCIFSDSNSSPEENMHLPCAPHGHIFFMADWLLWRTRQGGMEFAVQGASSSSQVPFPHSVPRKLNFDLQSGFRVGFGVHLPRDGWHISVHYTDFRPKASKDIHGSIFPLLLFNPPATVASSHAQWKIAFQTLDVEIGRIYYIIKTLSLRSFIGMTGAWIDQHAQLDYKEDAFNSESRIVTHNDFKGAGPRLGIGSNWHLGDGLSLFGNCAAILVVGHFDLKNHQTFGNLETIHLNSDLNLLSPVLQLIAGLAWNRNYHKGTRHVALSAGFETQYWGRQNQIEQFTDSSTPTLIRSSNDLAFYGLTVRGRLDF